MQTGTGVAKKEDVWVNTEYGLLRKFEPYPRAVLI